VPVRRARQARLAALDDLLGQAELGHREIEPRVHARELQYHQHEDAHQRERARRAHRPPQHRRRAQHERAGDPEQHCAERGHQQADCGSSRIE
jgi:hypothetical protein